MANDPPTNLRMGFGFHQARAAGLGGIREDRSPRQVNRLIKQRARRKKNIAYIREVLGFDPGWGPFVEHWVREGLNPEDVANSLHDAKFHMWQRAKGHKRYYRPPF
jgi:hypothetical protein